ncbi:hypothetical protein [Campylobacter concisus]|uniref:hypothetical protein n=1 Tax=Campylobacter concisus TaxID=199 RepID=UPI000CD9B73C|nr:hypothetical protein [Campylobacter concisus]
MISYKLFAKQGNFAVNPSNTAMLLGNGVLMAFKLKYRILLEKYTRYIKKGYKLAKVTTKILLITAR